MAWLESNAQSGGDYIVEVSANESLSPMILSYSSYSGISNVSITLKGTGTVRTVSLSSSGILFEVASGVTLILDNNITLQGRSGNNDALVRVYGTLVMNTGSCITGNTNTDYFGGGVTVNGGTFTMNGGTVSGNTAYGGGGVFAYYGTFTMNGGTISGNTTSNSSGGGGVYVASDGTFTMSGGTISGNTASSTGGGVSVDDEGIFTKTGGTIYGYSASDTVNSNVVKDGYGTVENNKGHAVYADQGYLSKRRETTAGSSVNLSFNGNNGTFSGGWDN